MIKKASLGFFTIALMVASAATGTFQSVDCCRIP